MEEVKYVHYSLPETREERVIEKLDLLIEKKLQERKMEKEREQRLVKAIIKIRDKYFQGNQGNAITKIIVGDFLIIQKEAVALDGIPIGEDEEGNTEIDVERILKKIEQLNEKDIVVI